MPGFFTSTPATGPCRRPRASAGCPGAQRPRILTFAPAHGRRTKSTKNPSETADRAETGPTYGQHRQKPCQARLAACPYVAKSTDDGLPSNGRKPLPGKAFSPAHDTVHTLPGGFSRMDSANPRPAWVWRLVRRWGPKTQKVSVRMCVPPCHERTDSTVTPHQPQRFSYVFSSYSSSRYGQIS